MKTLVLVRMHFWYFKNHHLFLPHFQEFESLLRTNRYFSVRKKGEKKDGQSEIQNSPFQLTQKRSNIPTMDELAIHDGERGANDEITMKIVEPLGPAIYCQSR